MSENDEIYSIAASVITGATRPDVMSSQITHFPLRGGWLCLDCENVTNNGISCPSCTSTKLKPLSELIEPVNDRPYETEKFDDLQTNANPNMSA